jgi:hypothetical protein
MQFSKTVPLYTAGVIQSWFEEHEVELQHLHGQQSPDMNITEPLWSVLEVKVNIFLPPASLKQLEDCKI